MVTFDSLWISEHGEYFALKINDDNSQFYVSNIVIGGGWGGGSRSAWFSLGLLLAKSKRIGNNYRSKK